MLTETQERILEYIRSYEAAHGKPPHYAHVAETVPNVGIAENVRYHMLRMEMMGLIETGLVLPSLTDRQVAVYQFIVQHLRDNYGVSPSIREIGNACGISSTSVVVYNLTRLQQHGLISRPLTGQKGRKSRSISLTGEEVPAAPLSADPQRAKLLAEIQQLRAANSYLQAENQAKAKKINELRGRIGGLQKHKANSIKQSVAPSAALSALATAWAQEDAKEGLTT